MPGFVGRARTGESRILEKQALQGHCAQLPRLQMRKVSPRRLGVRAGRVPDLLVLGPRSGQGPCRPV